MREHNHTPHQFGALVDGGSTLVAEHLLDTDRLVIRTIRINEAHTSDEPHASKTDAALYAVFTLRKRHLPHRTNFGCPKRFTLKADVVRADDVHPVAEGEVWTVFAWGFRTDIKIATVRELGEHVR